MNESQWAQVQARLDRLERQNRRLRRFLGVLVAGVVGAVGLGAAAAPKLRVVEAEQFIVRDRDGEARAVFGFDTGTEVVGLAIMDPAGARRAGIGVKPDGTAGVALKDAEGNLRAGLTTTTAGKSGLSLYNDEA